MMKILSHHSLMWSVRSQYDFFNSKRQTTYCTKEKSYLEIRYGRNPNPRATKISQLVGLGYPHHATSCEAKQQLFEDLVNTGLDIIMPLKKSHMYSNNPSRITPEFINLIKC